MACRTVLQPPSSCVPHLRGLPASTRRSWAAQGGLRPTAGAFFANWAAVMLVTLVAQTFGLLIGATVMDAKTAQTVTAVVMLTMMLVRPAARPPRHACLVAAAMACCDSLAEGHGVARDRWAGSM